MTFRRSLTESAIVPELEWTEPARADLIALIEYISEENPDVLKILRVLRGARQWQIDDES